MNINIFLIGLFVVSLCAVWLFDGSLYSYLGGFLSTALVLIASNSRIYNRVQNALESEESITLAHEAAQKYYKEDEEQKSDAKDDHNQASNQVTDPKTKSHFKRFNGFVFKSGLSLSFAPLRLIAYGVLIVIILALIKHKELEIISLFAGNTIAIITTIFCLKKFYSS